MADEPADKGGPTVLQGSVSLDASDPAMDALEAIDDDFEPTAPDEPCVGCEEQESDALREALGYLPVIGSGLDAYEAFQKGEIGWGVFHTAMAISDVTGVKALFAAAGKVAIKTAGKQAAKKGAKEGAKQGTKKGADAAAKKAAKRRLGENQLAGRLAEMEVRNKLEKEGFEVVAEQVAVKTPHTRRRIDLLVRDKRTGELRAVEVKSGGATRDAAQVRKDRALENGDAVFVGKNAGPLKGEPAKMKTDVYRVDRVNGDLVVEKAP